MRTLIHSKVYQHNLFKTILKKNSTFKFQLNSFYSLNHNLVKPIAASICNSRYYQCTPPNNKSNESILSKKNVADDDTHRVANRHQCNNDDVITNSLRDFFCSHDSTDTVTYIDMTFGDGKFTKFILDNLLNVKIICLDRDAESFKRAKVLSEADSRVVPFHGKFSDLPNYLNSIDYKFNSIDGMLFDFGISTSQLNSKRGFTPESKSILDMRMDNDGVMGYEVLGAIEEIELAKVLKIYGEEKKSKAIARAIIETRYTFRKIKTTDDLNELISAVVGTDVRYDPYKKMYVPVGQKVFEGLRRFVNNELNEMNYAMIVADKYIKPQGLVMTCCQSIVEDKIVKKHLTGNVIEHCASNLSLKFVNHGLTIDSESMDSFTSSPWDILSKNISRENKLKLRVASKK